MKVIKYISLVLALALTASCEKHALEYEATPVSNMAEFQLHYMVPVTSVAANNITRVEVNGELFANSKAPITPYNGIPSGSTGRFYTVDPGTVNIKMYEGSDEATLVYDQNVTLTTGKQNVVVHDFNTVPTVIDNGFPYVANVAEYTDSIQWVKFYNFMYETPGVPTTLRLQYQYVDYRTGALVNVGDPVAFGESTGWEPVVIVKTDIVSGGSQRVYYKIKIVDAGGTITGDLTIRNSSGSYVTYSDYWTGYIGRRVHHFLSGYRADTPGTAVRQFWAL